MLEIRGTSKSFSGQRVLQDVDLHVDAGSVHALLGENGSGKSTLIKIMSGYYVGDKGEVWVGDDRVPPGSPTAASRLGIRVVHQHLGLIDAMTVEENLQLTSDLSRHPLARARNKGAVSAKVALARVGVDVDPSSMVGALTPLGKAGTAIARALDDSAGPMRVLVLDEPTAAMSPGEMDDLFSLIRKISESGVAVLYVSHRLGEVMQLCDTATVIRDGVKVGTVPLGSDSQRVVIDMISGEPSQAVSDIDGDIERHPTVPALVVTHASARYVRDISLTVRQGEIVGVAGLDGSGRDVLPFLLSGASPGSVELETARGGARGRLTVGEANTLGIVLALPNSESASSVGEMSVSENITLGSLSGLVSRLISISKRREGVVAGRWLEALDIRPRQPQKILKELSGGNRQKVVLARALEKRPQVLILVDPTAGVDVGARQSIYRILQTEAQRGLSILLCSADIEDHVSVSDRVLCMSDGVVSAELHRKEITERRILQNITTAAVPALAVAGQSDGLRS